MPIFGGNVEIVFPWKTYIVHSDILRGSSGYFDGVFKWSGGGAGGGGTGGGGTGGGGTGGGGTGGGAGTGAGEARPGAGPGGAGPGPGGAGGGGGGTGGGGTGGGGTGGRTEGGSGGNGLHSSFVLGKDNFLRRRSLSGGTSNISPTASEEKDNYVIEQNFAEMLRSFYGDVPSQTPNKDPFEDSNDNTDLLPGIQRAWDNMLRAFYHRPVQIAMISDFCELIALADQYSALEAIAPAVEARLYRQGQEILSNAIRLHPSIFLNITYKIQSKPLFKEAFVHCVGQYALIKSHLHLPFLDPIHAEYQRLKDLRAKANEKIMSYGLDKDSSAVTPAIAAVCEVFRWVNCHYDKDTSFDGYSAGKLYRILSHDSFWDIDSTRGNKDFGIKLDELAGVPKFRCFGNKPTYKYEIDFMAFMRMVKQTTEELARNNLTLVPRLNHGINYLLCAKFNPEDFPGLKSETDWPY